MACRVIYTGDVQINEYVERELANHRRLLHPHVVLLKEVSVAATSGAASSCVFRQFLASTRYSLQNWLGLLSKGNGNLM